MTHAERVAAWLLAILWLSPLLYAFWAAFHPPAFATTFDPLLANNSATETTTVAALRKLYLPLVRR